MSHRIIEILRPRFEWVRLQAKAFGSVDHASVKGHLREELVQNLVEPYLPPMVKVVSGAIVSTAGNRQHRNQDDLVIFDRERAPLLLDMKECVIPIEGVLAQLEIKSILTRAEMTAAVLAATELRDLASDEAPCGLVFCENVGGLTESSKARRYAAANAGNHAAPRTRQRATPS